MCRGARTTGAHTTSERMTEGQGRSSSGYWFSTSRHGNGTQSTGLAGQTTRTGQGYHMSGSRGETGPWKTDHVKTTTRILSTSHKSKPIWLTTSISENSTGHSDVFGTSTFVLTSGSSSALPQNNKTQDPESSHRTVSRKLTATDHGDGSSSGYGTISWSSTKTHGADEDESSKSGGFSRLSTTYRSTGTIRPTASSGKNTNTTLRPSWFHSTLTSSGRYGTSVTKSSSTTGGGLSRLTRTTSSPLTSLESSTTTSILLTGTQKASSTWKGTKTSAKTTINLSDPRKWEPTWSQHGGDSQPQATSVSSTGSQSSTWMDTRYIQRYQSTAKSFLESTSTVHFLTETSRPTLSKPHETSPTSHISELAEMTIKLPTVTGPHSTQTSQTDDVSFPSSITALRPQIIEVKSL